MSGALLARRLCVLGALGLAALALGAPTAGAATMQQRWTVDGGGQLSFAGNFAVVGTAGQPDAGQLAGGTYTIWGGFWFPGPYGAVGGVEDGGTPPPAIMTLRCAPNPFKATTAINFEMPQAGWARVKVFDVSGRQVTTLADGLHAAGANTLTWDGSEHGQPLRSGVYFVALEAAGRVTTEKVLLVH